MIKIRRVKQEHSTSCGIACVAMIAGISYRKVLTIAKENIKWNRDNSFYTNYLNLKELLSLFNIKYSDGGKMLGLDLRPCNCCDKLFRKKQQLALGSLLSR
jgi:ABC-type bacteriocin/lantibiotic exporter with double-glycine peptidase domain